MFERYSERARRVLFFGRYEASQLGSLTIEPEHLLLGLLREGGRGGSWRFLERLPADFHTQLTRRVRSGEKMISTSVEMPFATATKRVLYAAAEESDRLKSSFIGTEHLLLGLLADPTTIACELLNANGLQLEAVRREMVERPAGAEDGVITPGTEFVLSGIGPRAASAIDSVVGVVERFRGHPACTDEGRQLIDRISRDLQALKAIVAKEGT
jgi:ATP-dependent Clp protease ATP-binding subunit ClpA